MSLRQLCHSLLAWELKRLLDQFEVGMSETLATRSYEVLLTMVYVNKVRSRKLKSIVEFWEIPDWNDLLIESAVKKHNETPRETVKEQPAHEAH